MIPRKVQGTVAALTIAALSGAAALADRQEPEPVAVVSSLSGNATVVARPSLLPRPVSLFDWLPGRSVITVEAVARLRIAFVNGRRCEIEGPSRVELTAKGPRVLSGTLRWLPAVPPFPRLPALARDSRPGLRSGAVRIRDGIDEPIRGLYPNGASTLASLTRLRFDPVDGAAGVYRVEIEDESGATVFEADLRSTSVEVPSAILQRGARYIWSVRISDRIGTPHRGQGEFVTLTDEDERRRLELARFVARGPAPELQALVAEIDDRLGLWLPARDGFRSALAANPDSEAVRTKLARIEARLSKGTLSSH